MTEDLIVPEPKEPQKVFFSPLLADVFHGNVPSYSATPVSIETTDTQFDSFLVDFRREADRRLIANIKEVNKVAALAGRTPAETRALRSDFWRREYGQHIYDINGQPIPSEVQTGGFVSITIPHKSQGELDIHHLRFSIHTHPSGDTLAPPDLVLFFAGIDPDKLFGEKRDITYPPITIQAVSGDNGYFLSFITQETWVPTEEEALIDGILTDPYKSIEDTQTRYHKVWQILLGKFGREKLSKFIGQKLEGPYSLFPDEVNDLGKELINMYHVLNLCEKYKLPLYFTDKLKGEFRKLSSIGDYYRELTE